MSLWESAGTAVEICLGFFAVLGVGFVAVCVLLDDRAESPLQPMRPYARFFVSSCLAMLVCAGLFFWVVFGFPDRIDPTDPPPTVFEEIVRAAFGVAMWPIVAAADILHRDPPMMPLWLLPTGMFWAFVVELPFVYRARAKRKSEQG